MRLAVCTVLLASSVALADDSPTAYLVTLPARVEFVAFLPVEKTPDAFVLDLRVEVVLPRSCGDKLAGLLKRDGATLDGKDEYDAVIQRAELAECKGDATRIGARTAIRMRVPDGKTRELTIGDKVIKVANAGGKITVDGEAPAGDVPGAPPTAPPSALVLGEVQSASCGRATPTTIPPLVAGKGPGTGKILDLVASVTFPRCVASPLGMLARGDASTKFQLTRFDPIAVAPLDGSCGKPGKPMAMKPKVLWRGGADFDITVGKKRVVPGEVAH